MIEVVMDKYDCSDISIQCSRCGGVFLARHIYTFPLLEKFEDEKEIALSLVPPILLVKQRAIYRSTSVKEIPKDYNFVKCPLCDTCIYDGFDIPHNSDRALSFKGIEEDKNHKTQKRKKKGPMKKTIEKGVISQFSVSGSAEGGIWSTMQGITTTTSNGGTYYD